MTDHFSSPKELIERAWDHTHDLERLIREFFERKPYTRIVDFDRDTGQDVYKIRLTANIPGKMSAIAKDAFSNLRDAMDHAAYASAVSLRGGSPRDTAFPFANNARGVHDLLNTKLIGVPPEIRSLLEGFRPHETGNQTLWGLNRTRNTKTHRMLVPLLAADVSQTINVSAGFMVSPSEFGYSRWNATKNEVEYARFARGSTVNHEINIAFDVLLGDVELFGGRPVLEVLRLCADEVTVVCLAIEAETSKFV